MAGLTKIIGLTILMTQVALAQWPTDPSQRLALGYGVENEIVSDDSGGAFVVLTNFGYTSTHAYLQKLDTYGYPHFSPVLYLDNGTGIQVMDMHAVTDGEGGVIIGVFERCTGLPEMFGRLSVYRFDQQGNTIYWNVSSDSEGMVPIQQYIVAAPDSQGGIYFSYQDDGFVRLQHLGPDGERLFGDEGRPVYVVGIAYPLPYDLTIGAGRDYCYVTCRGDSLQAFKYAYDGTACWGDSGKVIPDLGQQTKLTSDGLGGFVELYRQYLGGGWNFQLNVNRIDALGNPAWPDSGISLGDISADKDLVCKNPYIFVTWITYHDLIPDNAKMQKLDYLGNLLWPENISLFSGAEFQNFLEMRDANNTGLVISCMQSNQGFYTVPNTQKISYDGEVIWEQAGLPLSSRNLSSGNPNIDNNGFGGAICSWYEIDPGMGQLICSAMINAQGEMGVVSAVNDKDYIPSPATNGIYVFPNPANAAFNITYQLPRAQTVSFSLFNTLGQQVWKSVPGFQLPGSHALNFENARMPSGQYVLQFSTGSRQEARRITIIR